MKKKLYRYDFHAGEDDSGARIDRSDGFNWAADRGYFQVSEILQILQAMQTAIRNAIRILEAQQTDEDKERHDLGDCGNCVLCELKAAAEEIEIE